MPVEPFTVEVEEDRLETLADGQVDSEGDAWTEWQHNDLASLAHHAERAMAAFEAECFDVGADRLGDAQLVRCSPKGDVGLVVDLRSADVYRGGVLDDAFVFGVAVVPDDGAQPTGPPLPTR